MIRLIRKSFCGIFTTGMMLATVQAQVAQAPLLERGAAVEPNIVFVFDDSASMPADYFYQYGGNPGPLGMSGPSDTTYAKYSPDVNLMYYDPRVQYKLRVDANGTALPYALVGNSTNFKVYFHKPPATVSKGVQGASISSRGSGYSSAPTVTFSAPDLAGGVRATGTVTVSSGKVSSSVTITNAGSGYSATPTFSLSGGNASGFSVTLNAGTSISVANRPWNGNTDPSPTGLSSYFSAGSPAAYTPDTGSPLATGATSNVPYPNSASSTVTSYPKFLARTDCAGTTCSWTDERRNYSIWNEFHSTRMKLALTGIGLALQPLGATFRLGWGTINHLAATSGSTECQTVTACNAGTLDSGVQLFNTATKASFFTWLYALESDNTPAATPNRIAIDNVGRYFSRKDNDGPWGANPPGATAAGKSTNPGYGSANTSHVSCRRSYSILMTDGYYNDGASTASGPIPNTPGNWDSTWKGGLSPYKDTASGTLADIAMKYWATDLRPDLTNNVKIKPNLTKPQRTNDSSWQNMSFYGIGLGVFGTLPITEANLASLESGSTNWPVIADMSKDDPKKIDDLWHATVNGHGQMLNAKNADELKTSIQAMMDDIKGNEATQAGVAASAASLNTGTRKYTPKYTTGDWVGNVEAWNLDPNNGDEVSTAWQVADTVRDSVSGALSASGPSTIPAFGSRNIVVSNIDGASPKALNFANNGASSMTAAVRALIPSVNDDLVNFLRGDQANEVGGTAGTNLFRKRVTVLGDIVNSAPSFVFKTVDLNYDKLPAGTPGQSSYAYSDPVTSKRLGVDFKKSRTEGVLFVGANDGMLHGFRDPNGSETFAFVPRSVLPTINQLSLTSYAHRYYVDGPLAETDAYLGGAWKNVLLGTTGGGAKAVFALNVTDPVAMDASKVLWEINASSSGFSEMGHVLSEVQAGYTQSGQWVAIFGNGYDSASGISRLYVVDLATGAKIAELATGAGPSGSPSAKNGLGGVRLVRNAKQVIIGAYAGDVKGNLWRFDLSSSSAGSWSVSKLYAAGATKPISAPPAVLPHPNGGYTVVAGTGKLYETIDVTNTDVQSIYGIWDQSAFGAAAGATLSGTSSLVQQTITTVGVNYLVSRNPVDYGPPPPTPISPTAKRGWYIDLPISGQRLIYPVEVLSGKFVALDTVAPSATATDPCVASEKGLAPFIIVDGSTGAGPAEAIFDTNGDNTVDTSDALYNGFNSSIDGRNIILRVESRSNASRTTWASVSGGDSKGRDFQFSCGLLGTCPAPSSSSGKMIKTREWRQLFMR